MLIFPIDELPVLPKGKGNKLISISTKSFKEKSEFMMDVCCLAEDSKLHIHHEGKTGGKTWTLKNSRSMFLLEQSEGEFCLLDIMAGLCSKRFQNLVMLRLNSFS